MERGRPTSARARWRVPLAAAALVVGAGMARAEDAGAKACALLPIPELEALYGAKAGRPSLARDTAATSFCAIGIGDQSVMIQSASADAVESKTTVAQLLRRLTEATAGKKQKFEVRDFGDAACYRTRAVVGPESPPPSWGHVCFLVSGGKLMLELTSDPSRPLDLAVVRKLLARAAERRAAATHPP